MPGRGDRRRVGSHYTLHAIINYLPHVSILPTESYKQNPDALACFQWGNLAWSCSHKHTHSVQACTNIITGTHTNTGFFHWLHEHTQIKSCLSHCSRELSSSTMTICCCLFLLYAIVNSLCVLHCWWDKTRHSKVSPWLWKTRKRQYELSADRYTTILVNNLVIYRVNKQEEKKIFQAQACQI